MKNKIYIAIICAFSIVFAVSSGFLIKHYCDSAKQAEMYDNLIEVVETEPEETTELMNYSEEKTFIPEYQELYLQNNDMVGWIKVEDTKINYPVMQSKDNPNFYLKHGFDKAYTDYGCPYVQENCDMELPSDNVRILLFEFIDTATAQPVKAALPSAQKICNAFFDKLSYCVFELFCG